MRDNKTTKLLLFISLILIASTAFAQDEFVLDEGELDEEDAEALKKAQESILQYGTLSEQLTAFMIKNVENMEQLAAFFNGMILEQTTTLIIINIISNLSTLGIAYAIYLFLKSKKLI